MLDTQYRIKSVDGKELNQLVLILKHDPLHDTWFTTNESTSEKNKTISLHNGGKYPWTAANWYKTQLCTCTPFIWRTKDQLKYWFNSLVHIPAPPIVSTIRPTPNYPNWTTADSCRGRNSSLAHPPPFYLLHVYITWRHAGRKGECSRGSSAVGDCNELYKETPLHVFDFFFPLDYFSMYVSSL